MMPRTNTPSALPHMMAINSHCCSSTSQSTVPSERHGQADQPVSQRADDVTVGPGPVPSVISARDCCRSRMAAAVCDLHFLLLFLQQRQSLLLHCTALRLCTAAAVLRPRAADWTTRPASLGTASRRPRSRSRSPSKSERCCLHPHTHTHAAPQSNTAVALAVHIQHGHIGAIRVPNHGSHRPDAAIAVDSIGAQLVRCRQCTRRRFVTPAPAISAGGWKIKTKIMDHTNHAKTQDRMDGNR